MHYLKDERIRLGRPEIFPHVVELEGETHIDDLHAMAEEGSSAQNLWTIPGMKLIYFV